MLYKNDIFEWPNGEQPVWSRGPHRVLGVAPGTGHAWVISLADPTAWPLCTDWSVISGLEPVKGRSEVVSASAGAVTPERRVTRTATDAMRLVATRAWDRVGVLLEDARYLSESNLPLVLSRQHRNSLLKERAAELGVSVRTLHSDLRAYWQGGQSKNALLGNYHHCGGGKATLPRGRKPENLSYEIFDVTDTTREQFREVIVEVYLTNELKTFDGCYDELIKRYYTYVNSEGDIEQRPDGEKPSKRQFSYYLKKNYTVEFIARSRMGDKKFELNSHTALNDIASDCNGVGHYFEIDATIADVYLVARRDRRKIVGKPTLYLVIDRWSGLIVGWYIGFGNPSWISAVQAIASISADKREVCARLGLKYRPEDWPAHQVRPAQFLADRGEMASHMSRQISDEYDATVTNTKACSPFFKPLVELGFSLIHKAIQDSVPAYDPPRNAKARQNKKYEKDASMTLAEFERTVVSAIILRNSAPRKKANRPSQIIDGLNASPIQLWNKDIETRTGVLRRVDEAEVLLSLLPRTEASITHYGIQVNGCYYECDIGVRQGWFSQGRTRAGKILVSYDPRCVDRIYLHVKDGRTRAVIHEATLTSRSVEFSGHTVPEVQAEIAFLKRAGAASDGVIRNAKFAHSARVQPTIAHAKQALKDSGPPKSRSARKKDTVEARTQERDEEHEEAMSRQGGLIATSVEPSARASQIPQPQYVVQHQMVPPQPSGLGPTCVAQGVTKARLDALKRNMLGATHDHA